MNKDGRSLVYVADETGISAGVKKNVNTNGSELLVNLEGHQCPHNTTTENLSADEVFIGSKWQDMLDYGVLTVSVVTDVDSAEDGLEVQWSLDGYTPLDYDKFTILAGQSKTFTFGPAQRYYRLKYTNGSSPTSGFYLASVIRKNYVKPSSHRINDSIVGDDDAELGKSIITGKRPDGTYDNVNIAQHGTLLVSDTPSRLLISRILPHVNPIYGADMNIDGRFTGSTLSIYDGGDTSAWTPSAVSGTWDFTSTSQSHSGTYSINGTNTANGSIASFHDGGAISGYSAISMWVYLTAFDENKNNEIYVYFWEDTGPSMVGNREPISSYIDINLLGSWQKATINLSNFGLSGSELIDAVRIEVQSDTPASKAPDFYIDDIVLNENGGFVYNAIPRPNTNFYITSFRTIIERDVDIRLADSTVPNLDGNKLFGLSGLTDGIVQILSQGGEVKFSSTIHNLAEYLQIPNADMKNIISNGTTTLLTIDTMLPEPFYLTEGDYSRIIISDDLSSFTKLRILAAGIEESI